jgi:UDP-glucose:(heptosyl)LPS alpha-1,3-glucosyltransferase
MSATERRLRIAFVVHDYNRELGQGRYVAELATRIKRGHEVHVFANTFDDPDPFGLTYHHVPAWRRNAMTTILSFILPATRAVRGEFDIVHAQGLCGLRQDVVTAHICSAGWFEAADRFAGRQPWRKRVFRAVVTRAERLAFRRRAARRFIAVSERVRGDLARHYGLTDRVRVIPHGVDAETFTPRNRDRWRAEVRAELGLAAGEFVALYVGDWQKAGPPLVAALAGVPGTKLAVVTRSAPAAIARGATAAGVAGRVVVIPPTRRVERYYAGADVFLFPSFYDTFGMVVAEAMASGLPVVTSRSAGAAELIVPGESGLLTDGPWDVHALAAHLARLRDDPQLRHRLGVAARAAVEPHTWDRVAEETIAVYREVQAEGIR